MPKEIMICADFFIPGPDGTKIDAVHRRLSRRPHGTVGYIIDTQTHRPHHTVGGERPMLERIAKKHFQGRLIEIDGLGGHSINVSAAVAPGEFDRLRRDPYCRISSELTLE